MLARSGIQPGASTTMNHLWSPHRKNCTCHSFISPRMETSEYKKKEKTYFLQSAKLYWTKLLVSESREREWQWMTHLRMRA